MLTDQEIEAIRQQVRKESGDWHFDTMKFARAIEQAVINKVQNQEPVAHVDLERVLAGDQPLPPATKEKFTASQSPVYAHPVPEQQSPAVAVPDCVIADIKELIDFANQNSVAGSTTIPRHKVVEYLQLLIDVANGSSPRITEQDAREIVTAHCNYLDGDSDPIPDFEWNAPTWKNRLRALLDKLNKVKG